MRQLICRRTCEWFEIGYTYRAVRISYLVRLAEVAHIHIGYCKITTCYRARPDKRAQRCSVSSFDYSAAQLRGMGTSARSKMAYTWTTEKAVELIELYESKPLLYNTKEKKYRDRDMRSRSKALEEIANALNIPGRPFHYKLYFTK